MPQLTLIIFVLALLLLVPAVIVAGHRRPHGSIVLSSGATIIVFALFWLLGGPSTLFGGYFNNYPASVIIVYVLVFAVVLLLASWTLSLNSAAQARHWRWVALLIVAGLLSFGLTIQIFIFTSLQVQCIFEQNPSPAGGLVCQPVNPLVPILFVAGTFAGAVAALLYGLRPSLLTRRSLRQGGTHRLPDGLAVSHLDAADETTIDPHLSQ